MLTDLGVATRLAALACALALLVVLMLLPIAAPTHHLGETGWVTVALSLLVSSVVAVRILRWPELVTPNELMLYSYLALALIVTLQWLGGPRSPYMELFLVAALYTAAVHRPRRVIAYLVVLALAACAPLLYSPRWDDAEGLMLAVHVVLWGGAALLTMQFLRLGRQGLHREGEALRELARVDPLTRLGNRRAFDEALDRAIAGARRWARPLSVVVVDLVAFKAINDRFGHLEGDRCLRGVGGALLYTVRAPDACFRWGGDEFALVLPASDLAAGELVGERLRRTVAERVVLPDGQPLRLSWAAAQLEDGMDAELLLAAADTRLMARKGSASRARATAHQPRA
jgi:diguanylate cyclase (GGDEF)-like protein